VVGQLSTRTRHRVLAVAALDKSLSVVWLRWHISVSQLCCCYLWQSLSEWHLLLSACVLVYVYPLRELYRIMTTTAEWGENWKEEDSASVEVLFRNLHWEAEQNHGNCSSIGIRTGYV